MKKIILIPFTMLIIMSILYPTYSVKIRGNSMNPLYIDGEEVNVQEIRNENEINVGDIILFDNEKGNKILHRVQYIGEDMDGWYILSKGDNNDFLDSGLVINYENTNYRFPLKIRFEQILGKVN